MRAVPPIRNIAQSKGTGKTVTRMIASGARRTCQPGLNSSALRPARCRFKRYIPQTNPMQTASPTVSPSHCHDAIPAIGALAQAGKRSIQRIGTIRSNPTGELR